MCINYTQCRRREEESTNHHQHKPPSPHPLNVHRNMHPQEHANTRIIIRDSLESRQGSNATQHQNILTQISSTVTGTLEEERQHYTIIPPHNSRYMYSVPHGQNTAGLGPKCVCTPSKETPGRQKVVTDLPLPPQTIPRHMRRYRGQQTYTYICMCTRSNVG